MRSADVAASDEDNKDSKDKEIVAGVDIATAGESRLRQLLDSCETYEDRRKIRQRLKLIATNAKGGASVTKSSSHRETTQAGASSRFLRSDHGLRNNAKESAQKSHTTTTTSTSTKSTVKGLSSSFNAAGPAAAHRARE